MNSFSLTKVLYDCHMNKESVSRNIWGIIIVLAGVGFLLDALGLAEFNQLAATWWPMLLIVAALGALIGNPKNYILPLGLAVLGVLVQLRVLQLIDINIGALIWPIIVITGGMMLLFKQGKSREVTSNEDVSDLFAALAGIDSKINANDYQGGKATAILGGISLDLRKAEIKSTASLELFAFMGGVELKVPEHWQVNVAGTPLLGGWENKTVKPTAKKAPVLNITATCFMGGVEIKN
ncbi:MAG: hypothetical protein QG649_471 [Patescibacteria group bacterium]|nr:hypothetical protein [Patescibacteria group bacterium]